MTTQEKMMKLFSSLDETVIKEDYIRAPMSYPGGKRDSLEYILPLLPYRDCFVDVFGGGGSVLLNRRKSSLDVYNDRWSGVVAFYRCVRDKIKLDQLIERLSLTLHSREEHARARDTWKNCQDDVERAALWYTMVQFSFGAKFHHFGRGVKAPSMLWRKIHEKLDLFYPVHDRLKEVQIENLDYKSCFKDYDSFETVFYCDPPYVDKDIYEHKIDHSELCEKIFQLKGFVALSGYDNEIYKKYGWDSVHSWEVKNHIDGRSTRIEFLWIKEGD
jgi:DNA adenine methylase